jgi:nucleotide-binding universal stress UspA family protein
VVMVGFDGSAHAEAAFRFAVDEAARQGLAVRAIVAHDPPDPWLVQYGVRLLAEDDRLRQAVEDTARTRIEEIRGELDVARRAVPVDVVAISGPATPVLVHEARDAVQLVVGHRGRGALRSAALGSVGLGVLLHAPCPVTVVPPARYARDTAADEDSAPAGALPVGPVV